MLYGFNTKNSTYYLDDQRMVAWGGKLGSKEHCVGYIAAKVVQGQQAVIRLANGRDMITGTVQSLI
jgi:hypothetical protein